MSREWPRQRYSTGLDRGGRQHRPVTHNPKVGGSNPPPATIASRSGPVRKRRPSPLRGECAGGHAADAVSSASYGLLSLFRAVRFSPEFDPIRDARESAMAICTYCDREIL